MDYCISLTYEHLAMIILMLVQAGIQLWTIREAGSKKKY